MSSRVSQPLPSVSNHAGPNSALEYPVRGARPLTGKFSAALSAVWELACVGEVDGAWLDDGCAEGRLDGDAECAGELGLGSALGGTDDDLRVKPRVMHRRKPTMIAGHEYIQPRWLLT